MKEHKSRDKLTLVVGILVVILAAIALMIATAFYYRSRNGKGQEAETTKAVVKIPDITNAPDETEKTSRAAESSVQDTQASAETRSSTPNAEKKSDAPDAEATAAETETAGTEEMDAASEETTAGTALKGSVSAAEYIEEVNAATLDNPQSHRADIANLTEISAQEVLERINSYQVPGRSYLDGAARKEGDFAYTMSRRNLEAVKDPVTLYYGVLITNTAVRSFPTWQKLSDGTGADDADYLQETMLMTGEGVVVLHQTEDEIWSFVQADSYCGWIETQNIAFCSRSEMVSYIQSKNFMVVTEPVATVDGIALRMGTRLPLVDTADGSLVVQMPKSDENGKLTIREAGVDPAKVSEGYLTLSKEAIVKQARKLLGTNYGWGDSNGYMDCSSTLRAVYGCFGIILPRNTAWLTGSGLKVTDLSQMSRAEKEVFIQEMPEGGILLINGHAMIDIGQEDGVESMLHTVTQYKLTADGELERPMKCVITPVSICNSAGTSYLDLYTTAITIDWSRISEE